jgi:hypothetical protein
VPVRFGPPLSAGAAGEPADSTARRATITSGISEDWRNQFTRRGSRSRRVNTLTCRERARARSGHMDVREPVTSDAHQKKGGNPGSGVARRLFVEAHADQRPLSRLTTMNTGGSAASLPAAPANVASLPGWLFIKE